MRKLGREFTNNKFVVAKLALVFFICHADGISLLWTEMFLGNSPHNRKFSMKTHFLHLLLQTSLQGKLFRFLDFLKCFRDFLTK